MLRAVTIGKDMAKRLGVAAPALLFALIYLSDSLRRPLLELGLFFAGMLFWSWSLLCEDKREETKETVWLRASALAAAATLVLLLSDRPYQGMKIYPIVSLGLKIAVAISALALILILFRAKHAKQALALFVIAALSIRVAGLWQWEIHPSTRDMLALVISAIEALLAGDNPYTFHQMQVGSQIPLTYPPLLWLSHLPAYLLKLDIRWTAIASDLAITLGVAGTVLEHKRKYFGPVFFGLAVYLFLPDTIWNSIYAEPHFDWAVLVALALCIATRHPLLTGIVYGFALSTRPFNVILFPFIAIWLYRSFDLRHAWRALLFSAAVASRFLLTLCTVGSRCVLRRYGTLAARVWASTPQLVSRSTGPQWATI